MDDSVKRNIVRIEFLHKRNDIQNLCERLFIHMQDSFQQRENSEMYSRLTLVRALEEIFFPALVSVSGYTIFATNPRLDQVRQEFMLYPHHWLEFKDNSEYLIDVLPADGEFGFSVPQLVAHGGKFIRFFSARTTFPAGWGQVEREKFHKHVSALVTLFEQFIEERPL